MGEFVSLLRGPTSIFYHKNTRREVKNPDIAGARFIEPVRRAGFINETPTKNHFFTTLLGNFQVCSSSAPTATEKSEVTLSYDKLYYLT